MGKSYRMVIYQLGILTSWESWDPPSMLCYLKNMLCYSLTEFMNILGHYWMAGEISCSMTLLYHAYIYVCIHIYICICISNLEGYIYPLYAYTRKTKKNTNILQIRIRLVDIAAMTPSRSSILETNKYWLVVGPPL